MLIFQMRIHATLLGSDLLHSLYYMQNDSTYGCNYKKFLALMRLECLKDELRHFMV